MPVRAAGKAILDLGYIHSRVDTEDLFAGDTPKIYGELERTLAASEKYLNDSDTVIFSTVTLKRILTIFLSAKKPLPQYFWDKIILHIRRVWNYSADCVCYDAVETFASLLTLHLQQCAECLERPATDSHANCDWINEITQWLLEPTSLCRARFKCITHLVVQCPTLRLNLGEDFFRRVYDLIKNPSFSTVVFELVVDNIFHREDLWDFHCDLILLKLTENHDVKLIKTRLIPMLQKYQVTNIGDSKNKKKNKNGVEQETEAPTNIAVRFLSQLINQLNSLNPPIDLHSHLEIIHALLTTTWPRQKATDERLHLVDFSHWSQCVPETTLSTAIFHVDTEVRLSAFRLIVENPRRNVVFHENDIEYIKVFLDSNMALQSPSARHSLIATYKMMCQRLGSSAESFLKKKIASEKEKEPESVCSTLEDDNSGRAKWKLGEESYIHPIPESYIALVKWMSKLAFESLSPKGNYCRRIMALMQIDVLFNRESFITDGKTLFVDKLSLDSTLGSDRHMLVINCLNDSYDIVQSTALGLLKRLDFGNINLDEDEYISEVTQLMNSARTRNCSAAGYRIQYYLHKHPDRYTVFVSRFIEDLKKRMQHVEKELMNITKYPLHTILSMLELLLRNPTLQGDGELDKYYREQILDQLIPICHGVVAIVTPVVHNMSPEGCIPEEVLETLQGKTTNALAEISQHLLVCCWRAHKHVSGIFSWIVEAIAPKNTMTKTEIDTIKSYYWTQLTECKHVGAFESASEGFEQLCQFLWTNTNDTLPEPAVWLDEIVSTIQGEQDLSSLCATRRSAGLPHLVLSIILTEPKKYKNAALIRAAGSLLNMEEKSAESRVHSLNVMKAIIQNSKLSERAAFCYEETLRVAIDACRADWSERNAASQLFAALRTKIFGVMRSAQKTLEVDQKNRKSNYEFFSKFPSLYEYLFKQLQIEHSEFSFLPLLVLLTHLYTPESSTELYPLRPFIPPLLEIAMHDKRENLRTHAVAAILAISDIYAKEDLCSWIEHFQFKTARQNHIHSFLMLMEGLYRSEEYRKRIQGVVKQMVEAKVFKQWSDTNINALLSIVNLCEDIDYDSYDVPLQAICLAKRPLIEKMLLSREVFMTELSFIWKDIDARKEVYRSISRGGWEVCNPYLRAHVLNKAVGDLEAAHLFPQCDARNILKILFTASTYISPEVAQRVNTLIHECLDSPNLNWTMPSTIAYAMKLKYTYCSELEPKVISWIRDCYELDDPETKEIAVDVGGAFVMRLETKLSYTELEKTLIAAFALFLQDESEYIRQKASTYMSGLVKHNLSTAINPAICYLLVLKWCLNDGNEEFAKFYGDTKCEEQRDDLFDACAVNQYAEYSLFGDIQMYEASLGVSEVNPEMYDIEF
uniref:tRNA (32-2'-O)-methyltransferase regulator THADA n=1 Tax=Caenorhabditis japonica TaxID=281687 RepID=A0A8R1I038_CAEJA